MIALDVSGMVCGGCEKAVERALLARDPSAKVSVARDRGRVEAETRLSVEEAAAAVAAAGYGARPAAD
jgi:copper chaperone